MANSPMKVIAISSLAANDVDALNKEIRKQPEYRPISAYTYLGRTTILMERIDTPSRYEIDAIPLTFVNNLFEANQWLDAHPEWSLLSLATSGSKTHAYVSRRISEDN